MTGADHGEAFVRWIPLIVPFAAFWLVLCTYLIAAEVLSRIA